MARCVTTSPGHISFCSVLFSATDCVVSEWSEWSECNKSCGKGHMIRTRMVKLEPQFGGDPCPETIQRRKCKIRKCNRGQANSDEKKRRKEQREKRRSKQGRGEVTAEHPGGYPLFITFRTTREETLTKKNNREWTHCVDSFSLPLPWFLSLGCKMRPWSSWTECTKLCGGGIQERLMTVKLRFKIAQLPSCKDRKEIRACNVHPC